ncbi:MULTISPECIES: DUF2281 domain-containing protein [Cyanophyceae]|uniref:DUF2281 domain-containing protein n=1 Tax=Cyanophyceae TaxID=3028117 RepID=UPI001681CE49|nr:MULTISPECIES: DUF2281 domain-containing protein [Cyanophyceae]MBD1915021.1 DUF2281 domain-containing protein [Phormidium sp. FACHB-77]MBD2029330.1 DUF2281 domain-containing protein [Phormidium sp. FACHB-322]MBD2053189.1 DUF2281 domain-containing protein [Leptolyngbya sp. FACHB-60]
MTLKELLIQELDNASESVLVELLDFLQFLKAKQAEDTADILEARQALASVATEGALAWEDLKADVGL